MMQSNVARVCLCFAFLCPSAAGAIDTVEPFGAGNTDVELYVGGDGLGRRGEAGWSSTFQLGYGLDDRFSAYVNGSATGDTFAGGAAGSLRVGLYATVLDTTHLDVDLFLDAGTADEVAGMASGIEVNLDLGRVGLFATAWEDWKTLGRPALLLGALLTVADGHQLLAAYDHEACAVAAGYNVLVREGVELITEVGCEVPRDGATAAAFSVSTGILLTLP